MEKMMTDWEALYTKILSAGSNYEKAKKNIILTIILILLTSLTFAQTEKSTYKVVAAEFEKNYNADNFEAVFSMFSVIFI